MNFSNIWNSTLVLTQCFWLFPDHRTLMSAYRSAAEYTLVRLNKATDD
jgi:hypothetical protein